MSKAFVLFLWQPAADLPEAAPRQKYIRGFVLG